MSHAQSRLPRISVVAAARPNFMKVGPVVRALAGVAEVELVHTGQHYDRAMSEIFFEQLGLPEPDVNLEVGSGTHAEQTAAVMVSYERHLQARRPDAVVVVGDVNSTMATALAAVKLNLAVAHVEAGLRSHDWTMPEEVNRVVTDRVSTWHFAPSQDACDNLWTEGVSPGGIHLVGNVMVDSLLSATDIARERFTALSAELNLHSYAVLTLHRPANVDASERLKELLDAVNEVAEARPDLEIIFPVHPRAREKLGAIDLPSRVRPIDPLSYVEFIGLVDGAEIVFTDSGGLQEESSALGVPCVTLRNGTERPVTCWEGTNRIGGTTKDTIVAVGREALGGLRQPARIPYWDGNAGKRIADILLNDLGG